MTSITKPIPHHHFHEYDDDLLKNLIRMWREGCEKGEVPEPVFRELVDKAYAILGYRCALEYLEKYGD